MALKNKQGLSFQQASITPRKLQPTASPVLILPNCLPGTPPCHPGSIDAYGRCLQLQKEGQVRKLPGKTAWAWDSNHLIPPLLLHCPIMSYTLAHIDTHVHIAPSHLGHP